MRAHLIGVSGTGMGALALLFREAGHEVRGSDTSFAAPMGPALVTSDEIADAGNLKISLTINGETLQDSNTNKLIFGIPQLVENLSEVMTLEPGDVISTGTPPGVGAARNPKRFMRPGDVVNITIEGVGTLSNPVVTE